MSQRGKLPLDHPAFAARQIAGLKPWACTYTKHGRPFCVTLYGTSPENVLDFHQGRFRELRIEGQLLATIPEFDADAWPLIDAHERERADT